MQKITLRLDKEKAQFAIDEINLYVSDVSYHVQYVTDRSVDVTFHVPDFRLEVFCLNLIHAGQHYGFKYATK